MDQFIMFDKEFGLQNSSKGCRFGCFLSAVLITLLIIITTTNIEPFILAEIQSVSTSQYEHSRNQSKISLARHIDKPTKFPGLYDQDLLITPIQGKANFDDLIIGRSKILHHPNSTISLVQFYLATCPDCQGFSPYFRRFVTELGPHWHRLMKIFVVNCNDNLNINLCWRENPTLIVPLLRWYNFPKLIEPISGHSLPEDLLNVSHRQYIERQRRDLISLRRASIRFILSTVDYLETNNLKLYKEIPIQFKQFRQLGRLTQLKERDHSLNDFLLDFGERIKQCNNVLQNLSDIIENFIIFENRSSFVGRTIIADWSNFTCLQRDSNKFPIMIHFTNDLNILSKVKLKSAPENVIDLQPILFSFTSKLNDSLNYNDSENLNRIELRYLASNNSISSNSNRNYRQRLIKRHESGSSRDRLAQPVDFYRISRRRIDSVLISSAQTKQQQHQQLNSHYRFQRSTFDNNTNFFELEHINWAPKNLYPSEEELRINFNWVIGELILVKPEVNTIPGAALNGYLGEIQRSMKENQAALSYKEEDLSLVHLTDYYKVLDEIMHEDLVSKAQIDGYKAATVICFLHDLINLFPFQGGHENLHKSVSRNYLKQVHWSLIKELRAKSIDGGNHFSGCSSHFNAKSLNFLDEINPITSDHFEQIQRNVTKIYQIGLPSSEKLKWSYCRGSSEYLRGHTCSIWILFHTLTVEEFLNNKIVSQEDEDPDEVYEFTINYTKPVKGSQVSCNPKDPEPGLINAKSSELFVNRPQFTLANIINFVRFYLPCTNCASHFSCMVAHSNIDFRSPRPGDHLLWLWEAHNRVNLRTKKTHSEDPLHPKHLFPNYEACPNCYKTKPDENFEVDWQEQLYKIEFNRHELISFLVNRYKRSAIVNNKIRIEDLFKKNSSNETNANKQGKL